MYDNHFLQFINFSNAFEVLREINNTKQGNKYCHRISISIIKHFSFFLEISNTLETSRDLTTLKTKWSAWQDVLSQKQNEYYQILQLLNNASEANGD